MTGFGQACQSMLGASERRAYDHGQGGDDERGVVHRGSARLVETPRVCPKARPPASRNRRREMDRILTTAPRCLALGREPRGPASTRFARVSQATSHASLLA
jgi:hypothetical protein